MVWLRQRFAVEGGAGPRSSCRTTVRISFSTTTLTSSRYIAGCRERMARKLRPQYSGAIYHAMNRGNRREAIFNGDEDRVHFWTRWHKPAKKLIGRFMCYGFF
jgi:hypothetical protein